MWDTKTFDTFYQLAAVSKLDYYERQFYHMLHMLAAQCKYINIKAQNYFVLLMYIASFDYHPTFSFPALSYTTRYCNKTKISGAVYGNITNADMYLIILRVISIYY